ncbi:hypothetical protein HDU89_008553 [Geranomyces variabilis]|nr:hypothetical protein HDU89_008553 [Geranomyces variabilis]
MERTPTTLRERLAAAERASVVSSKKPSTKASKHVATTPIARVGEKRKPTTPASEKTPKRPRLVPTAPEHVASPSPTNDSDSVVSKLRAAGAVAGIRGPAVEVVEDLEEDSDEKDPAATPRTLAERLKAREQAAAKDGKQGKPRREQSQEATKASAAVPTASSPALPASQPADVAPATPVTSNAKKTPAKAKLAVSAALDVTQVSTPTPRPSLSDATSASPKRKERQSRTSITPGKVIPAAGVNVSLTRPDSGSRSFGKKWVSRDLHEMPAKCSCINAGRAESLWGFLIACLNRDICAGSTWYHPECMLPADAPDPTTMSQVARRAHLKGLRVLCQSCLETPPDWPAALTMNAAPPSTENCVFEVPLITTNGPLAPPPATPAAAPGPTSPERAESDKTATPAAAALKLTVLNANGSGLEVASAGRKASRLASPATRAPSTPQPGGELVALSITSKPAVPPTPTPLASAPILTPQSAPIRNFGVPGFGGFVPPTYSDEDEAGGNAPPVFEVLDEVKALLRQDTQRAKTVERAFACTFPTCRATYRFEGGLRKHEQTHAKGDSLPFTCTAPGCGKGYITRAGLEYHNSRGKCSGRSA